MTYQLSDPPFDAVLVLGGSRKLKGLYECRRRGIPIVQRLGGLNWLHRTLKCHVRQRVVGDVRNGLQALVRNYLADHIVYQSQFVKEWWEIAHGPTPKPNTVIWNGVDLDLYRPTGQEVIENSLLCVEGNIRAGYEMGLKWFIEACLDAMVRHQRSVSITVVGNIDPVLKTDLDSYDWINCVGEVPEQDVHHFYERAACFVSLDVHAACPNSVIEALAAGVPVVGFSTGALPELVPPTAGVCVPFGGDPWELSQPDVNALGDAIAGALDARSDLARGARSTAEKHLGLSAMTDRYLAILGGLAGER